MTSLSILVIDPSTDRWIPARRWLEPHHTARVHCGSDALAALAVLQFDMVILDPALPDVEGRNVLRRIRQTQPWARTVALAGQDPAQFRELGTDDILSRPVIESQLRQTVALALVPREPQLN